MPELRKRPSKNPPKAISKRRKLSTIPESTPPMDIFSEGKGKSNSEAEAKTEAEEKQLITDAPSTKEFIDGVVKLINSYEKFWENDGIFKLLQEMLEKKSISAEEQIQILRQYCTIMHPDHGIQFVFKQRDLFRLIVGENKYPFVFCLTYDPKFESPFGFEPKGYYKENTVLQLPELPPRAKAKLPESFKIYDLCTSLKNKGWQIEEIPCEILTLETIKKDLFYYIGYETLEAIENFIKDKELKSFITTKLDEESEEEEEEEEEKMNEKEEKIVSEKDCELLLGFVEALPSEQSSLSDPNVTQKQLQLLMQSPTSYSGSFQYSFVENLQFNYALQNLVIQPNPNQQQQQQTYFSGGVRLPTFFQQPQNMQHANSNSNFLDTFTTTNTSDLTIVPSSFTSTISPSKNSGGTI